MKPQFRLPSLSLACLILLSGCGGGGGGGGSTPTTLHAEQIVEGLSFPTALKFLPNGDILFTEKSTGLLRKVSGGAVLSTPVATFAVEDDGERGLLGLAIDPNYTTNKYVYVYHTTADGTHNQVVRVEDSVSGPNPTVIVANLNANGNHNGGKLDIGPDGKLYVTVGDTGDPANSQNDNSTSGKVLRYNLDGTIPSDNPIPGNPLFSKGHRNCFGLAVDPDSGTVFVSENGPNCDDEINRATANGNFGWRPAQPCNDSDPAYLAPIAKFSSVIAPTGIAVGTGAYANSLFMGSLNDKKLRQFQFASFPGGTISSQSVVYTSPSDAIIDVTMGPDGNPYIAVTDYGTNGRILRLVP